MDALIGLIVPVAFNFAPNGWLICNGAQLPLSNYQALFSLIGTTYGGNGTSNFNLPDLRGRTIVGVGKLTNGGTYNIGSQLGSEAVTLKAANLPAHTHTLTVNANSTAQNMATPSSSVMLGGGGTPNIYSTTAADSNMGAGSMMIGNYGASLPLDIRNPYLTMNYIICNLGIYPTKP